MTIYTVFPGATSIIVLGLGIFVLTKNRQSQIHRLFSLWCSLIFIWLFFYSLCYSIDDAELAEVFIRIACSAVTAIPVAFLSFANSFLQLRINKFIITVFYFVSFVFIILSFTTNYLIVDSHKYFFGYYGVVGNPYILVPLYFAITVAFTLTKMYQQIAYGNLTPAFQLKAKYLFAAFCIAYLAGVDFIPKYGFEFYPFGFIFILIWAFLTTHLILKHNIFDIVVVIKRSVIYSILIAVITVIYLAIVLISENLFRGILGYRTPITSFVTSIIIALIFIPLKNFVQEWVEKRFFKGSTVQLADQNEQLKVQISESDKYRIAANLSSGLAHEIKNPLTSIKTFAQHLPDKANDPEFVQKFSSIVNTEVERINDLVHQLLDFAKPNPPQFQQVDIEKLLGDILQFLNNDLLKHRITLKTDFQLGAQRTINADPNQLRQAFLNLLLNAIEAMPGGGVLTISASRTTNPEARITIEDTGPGIAPKDLPKIFEPFYSKKEKGTGLGLAITKTIIEQHGGKITAECTRNKGANFNILLK